MEKRIGLATDSLLGEGRRGRLKKGRKRRLGEECGEEGGEQGESDAEDEDEKEEEREAVEEADISMRTERMRVGRVQAGG